MTYRDAITFSLLRSTLRNHPVGMLADYLARRLGLDEGLIVGVARRFPWHFDVRTSQYGTAIDLRAFSR